MKYKSLALVGVGLLVGFLVFSSRGGLNLGAVISPSAALDQQFLINDFNSLTADLQGVRAPLAGLYASSSQNFAFATLGPVGANTSTASTTLTFTTSAGNGPFVLGDVIVLGESTTTPGVALTATILTSSTVQILGAGEQAQSVLPATTTLFLWDLPRGSFTAPAALQTTTST